MGTGKILQGVLGLTNPLNAIYNKLTTGEFVPGIDVGAAVDQLVTGTDRDNVLHAVNSRLILHAFQSGYVMRQFPVDSFRPGDAQQFGATLLF